MKISKKRFKSEYPKCLYCEHYAMWEGDNVCFDKAEPKIFDPQRVEDCSSFTPFTCRTKEAIEAVAITNELRYDAWLKNGDKFE